MLKLQTKAELEALHTGNVKEGLHLEYKASDAIDKKTTAKKMKWLAMFQRLQMQMGAKLSTA
jgi:hypothetical protein